MTHAEPVLVVSCALVREHVALFAQRPRGTHRGSWETPGGKVEPGESPAHAVTRELYEEIGVLVRPASLHAVAFVESVSGTVPFHMMLYAVHAWDGEPSPREGQALRWARPRRWRAAELTPGTRAAMPRLREYVR